MFTRNKLTVVLWCALTAWAQEASFDTRSSVKIQFPPDSPVSFVSADWGESRASARGSAMVVDLRTSLTLKNSSASRVRGITLLVSAQEVTPGGKASVSVPSLNVGSGETFPVRIDLRLLKPLPAPGSPLVTVSLDGVLFDDLSFYGPDRLHSRRFMTVWELEAGRDRQHYKSVLAAQGPEGLRKEILEVLSRQAERLRLDVAVSRGGRATNLPAEREVQFAFLRFPGAPLEPLSGLARVAGNEVHGPSVEVRNASGRAVRYFEIGWIIEDPQGKSFLAGSVSGPGTETMLGPGGRARVVQEASLRFSNEQGKPIAVKGMTGYLSQVEFADGSIWIPSREALRDPKLAAAGLLSAEEQRLAELYRRKGLAAVVAELKKF
jgi:hypothetical protein